MKWKKLASKYLFQKPPWLVVRKDKLQMTNGEIMDDYFVFEYPNWVNTIAITRDQKFVMVRQYRHALGEVNFELCAGVCDDTDKDPLESARRELLEETGYGGGNWEKWMVNSANPGTHTNLTYCYLATDVVWKQEQSLDSTEEISVHLLSLSEVLQMLETDEIRQSLHAAALWKYIASKSNL